MPFLSQGPPNKGYGRTSFSSRGVIPITGMGRRPFCLMQGPPNNGYGRMPGKMPFAFLWVLIIVITSAVYRAKIAATATIDHKLQWWLSGEVWNPHKPSYVTSLNRSAILWLNGYCITVKHFGYFHHIGHLSCKPVVYVMHYKLQWRVPMSFWIRV